MGLLGAELYIDGMAYCPGMGVPVLQMTASAERIPTMPWLMPQRRARVRCRRLSIHTSRRHTCL